MNISPTFTRMGSLATALPRLSRRRICTQTGSSSEKRSVSSWESGSVMVLLVTVFLANGIAVTLYDNNVEIIWLVVAISAIMLYKFYGDILQQVDGLTELGNRWSFEDHLKRYRGAGVILFFDVDHFKMINDTYGHAVGDKCLCTVAQGLREVYGASGRCFRMGGDEFCVVLRRDLDRACLLYTSPSPRDCS